MKNAITWNKAGLRTLDRYMTEAIEKTVDAVLTEIKNKQVIPFDTGNLQNESTFADLTNSRTGKAKIVSSTPYARRLYFHPEYHFQRQHNARAGSHWFEPWLKGEYKDHAKKIYAKFMRSKI